MADIVDQHGPLRSLGWFASNMPTYEKILKAWGPLRTHYLAVVISATNGCGYCSYGHAYAFSLHYFKERGLVFPLSEEQMRAASGLGKAEATALFRQALVDGALEAEMSWVDRTLVVAESRHARGQDEKWMLHLVEMFAWLNACGIAADTTPDAAHDPINKDVALQERYAVARAAA